MTVRICIFLLVIVNLCFSQVQLKKFGFQNPRNGCGKICIGKHNGTEYYFACQTPKSYPYEDLTSTYKIEVYNWNGVLQYVKDTGLGNDPDDHGHIWLTAFIFGDINEDGKEELMMRKKEGSNYYLVIYNETGGELARISWPSWYNWMNDRHLIAIANLDGLESKPSIILQVNTYNDIKLAAYDFDNGTITQRWYNHAFGDDKGGHWIEVIDYDADGNDEFLIGSNLVDEYGQLVWSGNLGHCDIVTPRDFWPLNPGLEFFFGICTDSAPIRGVRLLDVNGNVLHSWSNSTAHIHGGWSADICGGPGVETWFHDTGVDPSVAYFVDSSMTLISNLWLANNTSILWRDSGKYDYLCRSGTYGDRVKVYQYQKIVLMDKDAWGEFIAMNITDVPNEEVITTDINYLWVWSNDGNPVYDDPQDNHYYYLSSRRTGSGYGHHTYVINPGPVVSYMDTVYACLSDSLPEFSVSGHVGLTISISKVIPYNFNTQVVWNHDCASFISEIRDKYAFFLSLKIAECDSAITEWQDKKDGYLYELYTF